MVKKIAVFCLIIFFSLLAAFSAEDYEEPQVLVNNIFYETDVRQALQDISAQTNIPIVIDPSVQGFINIELKSVPLDEALEMILVPLGYTYKRIDNYYVAGLARPESPVFNLLAKTEVISLDYIKAKDVNDLVSDFFHPFIKANLQNNSVTITAPQNIIDRFIEDIKKIDRPRRQVMMEALVVEISEAGKKELGIEWGSMQEGGFTVSPPSSFTYDNYVGTTVNDQFEFSGTVTQDTLVTLKTMIQEGKAVVRANPRISSLDGEQASIFIGKEEYFLINTGSQAYPYNTLESIGTGVTLKITPSVSSVGSITVKIEPEVSEVVGTGTSDLPIVNKRTVSTTVRVFDGETIVIGGLVQHKSSVTDTRAPVLGKIPILGGLFKSKGSTTEDKEVLIFITPHLSDLVEKLMEVDAKPIKDSQKTFFAKRQSPYQPSQAYRGSYLNRPRNGYDDSSANMTDVFDNEEYLLNRYIDYVREIINTSEVRHLLMALYDYTVINDQVLARFTVSSSGYVNNVSIVKSSGSDIIDRTIKDAIVQSSPLPKFPSGVRKRSLDLTMAFHLR
ncbi:MAG: TonB family protein [Candidatus Omnitrophica bacterium]|nr:TonB family protein [Candidatus Omnitrophota bacterium]